MLFSICYVYIYSHTYFFPFWRERWWWIFHFFRVKMWKKGKKSIKTYKKRWVEYVWLYDDDDEKICNPNNRKNGKNEEYTVRFDMWWNFDYVHVFIIYLQKICTHITCMYVEAFLSVVTSNENDAMMMTKEIDAFYVLLHELFILCYGINCWIFDCNYLYFTLKYLFLLNCAIFLVFGAIWYKRVNQKLDFVWHRKHKKSLNYLNINANCIT